MNKRGDMREDVHEDIHVDVCRDIHVQGNSDVDIPIKIVIGM